MYRLLCAENCNETNDLVAEIPVDQQSSYFELNDQLVAFPNPATDNISVALKTGMLRSIRIFNNQGKQAEYIQFDEELKLHTISIRNWPEGLYVIQAEDLNGKMYTGKFELIR